MKRCLVMILATFGVIPEARARFNNQGLDPTYNHQFVLVEVPQKESAIVQNISILQYDYIQEPLIETNTKSGISTPIIDSSHDLIYGHMFRKNQFSLSIDSLLSRITGYQEEAVTVAGDSRISMRVDGRFENVSYLYGVNLFVPTGYSRLFLSSGSMGSGVFFGMAKELASSTIAANFNYIYNRDATFETLDYSSIVKGSMGFTTHLLPDLKANLEWFGTVPVKSVPTSTGEIYGGLVWQAESFTSINSGISVANIADSRNSILRFVAGLKYTWPEKQHNTTDTSATKSSSVVNIYNYGSPSLQTCQDVSVSTLAHKLSDNEKESFVEYPYFTDKQNPNGLALMDIGQLSGRSANGVSYVKDRQVVFGFKTKLPDGFKKVNEANLILDVTKISRDARPKTELLCDLVSRRCSGTTFDSPKWKSLINLGFFKNGNPVDQVFDQDLVANEVEAFSGNKLYSTSMNVDVIRLIEQPARNDIDEYNVYFVVADDVFVASNATLFLKIEVCGK